MNIAKVITVILLIVSYSCNSSSDRAVRTFHQASDGSNLDMIYDPENNVIIYIDKNMGLYGPTVGRVRTLDLNKKRFSTITDIKETKDSI